MNDDQDQQAARGEDAATRHGKIEQLGFKAGDAPGILTVRRVDDGLQHRGATRTYLEPAREIPVYGETDVLVVGGGPAGCAAAVAAARTGAEVTLVERYGYLGGLSTGGLVIWIDRMTDWQGQQVIQGFAVDMLDRMPKGSVSGSPRTQWGSKDPIFNHHWRQRLGSYRDIVTWSPTLDPEWLKLESLKMLLEAGVKLVLHAWAVTPIMDGTTLKGAVFESKEGRQALFAKVVVDASGDGDIFSQTGAAYFSDVDEKSMHHSVNTAWMWGGVDMNRWINFRTINADEWNAIVAQGREQLGELERPYVSWRNDVALFLGPRLTGYSAIKVDDLTAVEIESRRWMVDLLAFYRAHVPGFENAWILETAAQVGVRHSRRLRGTHQLMRDDWQAGRYFADEVGVSPSLSPAFPSVSVPYGSLVAAEVDGLLAPGRHMATDASSHTFMREIPQCWLSGQAAGAAAGLAANRGVPPRAVDVPELQQTLRRQGVYLRLPSEMPAESIQRAEPEAVSA